MKKYIECDFKLYLESIMNEDAMATAGNSDGMGAVTPSIPSSTPGDVAGSTVGSIDTPNGGGVRKRDDIFDFDKKTTKGRGFAYKNYKTLKDFLKRKKQLNDIYGNVV